MVKNKAKLQGVIVKFERSIFLNAEEYDLSDLDRETIRELAVNQWNNEMSIDDTEMSEDDVAEIKAELYNSKGQTIVMDINDLED